MRLLRVARNDLLFLHPGINPDNAIKGGFHEENMGQGCIDFNAGNSGALCGGGKNV